MQTAHLTPPPDQDPAPPAPVAGSGPGCEPTYATFGAMTPAWPAARGRNRRRPVPPGPPDIARPPSQDGHQDKHPDNRHRHRGHRKERPARVLNHLDLGSGAPVVIMHGYALQPRTYLGLARLLAGRCRVILPSLFDGPGRWSSARVQQDLRLTLDSLGVDRVTLIGHSFGGALTLNFAALYPERVEEVVFVDTLAMSREWTLAAEAVHPVHLVWMATPRATIDFFHSWISHPLQLADAAWWGFTSDRREEVKVLATSTMARHVMWASRDSLLTRADGQQFAEDMGADFTVVGDPAGGNPVDHDWLYRHPQLAVAELERAGLGALRPRG